MNTPAGLSVQLDRRAVIRSVVAMTLAVAANGIGSHAFFAYDHYEGIPRVLDLMDKHGIKLSSFMIMDRGPANHTGLSGPTG